jgi:hypothetical protein
LIRQALDDSGDCAEAPHACGGQTSQRLHRLLEPPPPLPRPAQALAALARLLLPVVAMLIVVPGWFVPVLAGHIGVL